MSLPARRFNPAAPAPETPEPQLRVLPPPGSTGASPVVLDAPSSTPTGLKKLNLTGMVKKSAEVKSEFPVFPDPKGEASALAAQIREESEIFDSVEGSLKSNKKSLIELITPYHFQICAGKVEPSKALLIESPRGRVRVDMKNSYPAVEERFLVPLLGDKINDLFRQSITIEIDGDKIPVDAAAQLIAELQTLFASHGATEALSYKEQIKPVTDFHIKRHLLFDAQRNFQIHQVCPLRAAVAVKNVK